MSIKILIADDMFEVADHFAFILQNEPDFEVVGTVNSATDCIKVAKNTTPDIILMDIQMETDGAGFYATKTILSYMPDTKIIMLTAYNDTQNILSAFEAGATDFLEKKSSIVEVINTIKEAAVSKPFSKTINRTIVDELAKKKKNQKNILICANLLSPLSSRDIAILKKLCEGKKYKDIASEEFIEESTVRSKVNKISKKIGKYSIRELINIINSCDFFELLAQYDE